MADRYWVGGTGTWDSTNTTNWSATSGGSGGASVPTSADNVFFDANSGGGTATTNGLVQTLSLTTTGYTGSILSTSASDTLQIFGSFICDTSTIGHEGALFFLASSGTNTIQFDAAGVFAFEIWFGGDGSTATWNITNDLLFGGDIYVYSGTVNTNNYSIYLSNLIGTGNFTTTLNLGSSLVTCSSINITNPNFSLNAGTSNIQLPNAFSSITTPGFNFYDVTFSNTLRTTSSITGANTFRNLTINGRTSTGIGSLVLNNNQTITGTLNLSAGTNSPMRTFVRSGTIGTTRTLTCNSVLATDIDFRDITIAGAAAPASGTRLGDCGGNNGITFDAPKTVYYAQASSTNWGATNTWSLTNGGAFTQAAFPLAQDTAVFPSSPTPYPSSGNTVTINAAYNIGNIDMSARTSNTMTLATSTLSPIIYGNWINGTGTTLTGTGTLTFAGRGSQTITSAGKTFTQTITINTPTGSVTLQDAFIAGRNAAGALTVTSGTFDANDYNVSISGASASFLSSNSNLRTVDIGSGTWTLSGTGGWNCLTSTNLTVLGTGTISLTSSSAKLFAGGGIQTYPTINQGGSGVLSITGSNKFVSITNTSFGPVYFVGGTTNEFTNFLLSGNISNSLIVSSGDSTQFILKKPTAWNVGANSTDGGNNTGLSFTAGDIDYLNISYVNGQISSAPIVINPLRHRLTSFGNLLTNTFLDSTTVTVPRFASDSIVGVLDEVTFKSDSIYFDGNDDYLEIANNSSLQLSSGDFTIEAWVRYNEATGIGRRIIGKGDTTLSNMEYFFQVNNAYALVFSYSLNGTTSNPLGSSGLTSATWLGRWNHVAATRSGSDIRIFLNGNLVGSTVLASDFFTGSSNIFIGATPILTNDWSGNISNLRVIKGTALYTSNFTVPSQVLEPVTNTVLLLNCLPGQPFIDSSGNQFTLTPNGNVAANTLSPFQDYATMRLDKNGSIIIAGEFNEYDSLI